MGHARLAAVIEVRADGRGRVPVPLIRAAYRASREGTVALLLNGVSAAQVDRALDDVVPRVSDVAGVVYCPPATLDALVQQAGWPRVAFVTTRTLAATLAEGGVRVLPVAEAQAALDAWSADVRWEAPPEGRRSWR